MRALMLKLLAAYKRWLSPQLPAACRYTPSCSDYAAEAVTRHGALGGTLLALWRLLRCHPLGGRGLDPVPEGFGCRRSRSAAQRLATGTGGTGQPAALRPLAPGRRNH
jgi:putative membrane protein insertion efficiency factor